MASKVRSKQSQKQSNGKLPKLSLSADELFAPEGAYYRSDDIKAMRRKLAGKTFTIASVEIIDFDGNACVFIETHELDLALRVNKSNGRSLAEELGNDLNQWVGKEITITAKKYSTGWGVLMSPVVDDDAAEAA